jgi:hypothetical protein
MERKSSFKQVDLFSVFQEKLRTFLRYHSFLLRIQILIWTNWHVKDDMIMIIMIVYWICFGHTQPRLSYMLICLLIWSAMTRRGKERGLPAVRYSTTTDDMTHPAIRTETRCLLVPLVTARRLSACMPCTPSHCSFDPCDIASLPAVSALRTLHLLTCQPANLLPARTIVDVLSPASHLTTPVR